MDNQSWIFIHGYCVEESCHIPILLVVEHVLEGSNAHTLTRVRSWIHFPFMVVYRIKGIQHVIMIPCRWCGYIFQGACHRTIVKIWEVHTLLLTKINCMVDKTNLVVQTHYFACGSIPRRLIQFFFKF
jgi:hypothetical protein